MKNVLNVFFLLFLSNLVFAQEPNDCATALIVCGNGAFSSNSTGSGNFQEINSCGGFESNSIWLEVNIVQGGTLGFNLIPDDPDISVDYDFWVFGPNAVCGALGSPLRCATTNPFEAGLTDNLTGMNGSTLLTQTGPGADGNGYVRWLTVSPGQTYFIAIDRPIGDGGFQIQWTGTATSGTGAFPSPPSANHIPDVLTCSNTPNVGIFDLNAVRALINSDTTGNTITFHNSITDANDGINALPTIYSNISNPETIYVRVTDNTGGCFAITDFDLVVNLVPNASVSISNISVCIGSPVTVTFTGTPNSNINYTVDSGAVQSAFLNAAGTFTITASPALATTYTLTNVRIIDGTGNTVCSQSLNQTVSVTVVPLPTVTISGTTTICSGTSAVITFNGTPNATVTYTVDSGPNQTIILNGSGNATLTTPLLTVNSSYNLVSIASSGTPICSQSQTGSAVVTVISLPTAAISGSTSVCSGSAAVITFIGTPNATVTYTVNGGSNQTIVLNNSGNATLNTANLTLITTYALVSATIGSCSQSQSGSAVITISATPTATISGTTTICSGTTTVITFSGTPNATVTYTINSGSNQTIVLSGAGAASLTTPALTLNTTYNLVSVALPGTPPCSQLLNGSAVVTVRASLSASISGTTTICSGNSVAIIFTGTPNATVTYTVDSGGNQTIVLGASGNASLTTPFLTTSSTYSLVSVSLSGTPICTQAQTGSALVTVNALPVITNVPANASYCSGDLVTTNAFVSSPTGANFTWTNSTPSLGLAAAGTGNIPNFTASNGTSSPITGTITIVAIRNGCSTTGSYTITVNPIPLPNPVITDYELCDYNNTGDGIELFNLGTKSMEIANGQTGVTV
uniref:beta strand repeat-containing protein n=1 Tax=Flavobacterium sp. TaxID=239 RepID=UPI0038D4142D